MREIKFRVWNKGLKKFNPAGLPIAHNSEKGIFGVDDSGAVVLVKFSPEHYVENFVVQQYTGLKDKNGVEIYEGDIIQWLDNDDGEPNAAEVKYGVGEFDGGHYKYIGFYLEGNGRILEPYEVTNMVTDTKWYKYEVIGNIFEGVDK